MVSAGACEKASVAEAIKNMQHSNAFVIGKGEKQLKVTLDDIKQKCLYINGKDERS